MKRDKKLYWKLFTSTFYISAFTFGGGFVIVPLMKKKFVGDLKWIEEEEMLNLTAIAQSSPGAIAVNASILLGYRVAGFLGSLCCIFGTILPPLLILSVVSTFYSAFRDNSTIQVLLKGFQSGVAAVIADVVIQMGGDIFKSKSIMSILILAFSFIATYFLNIHVIYVLLASAIIGALTFFYNNKCNIDDRESEAHT